MGVQILAEKGGLGEIEDEGIREGVPGIPKNLYEIIPIFPKKFPFLELCAIDHSRVRLTSINKRRFL